MRKLVALATLATAHAGGGYIKKGGGGQYASNVATATPILTCPDGYAEEGSRCVKHIAQAQMATCIEGVLQADNTCLVVIAPQKVCGVDFVVVGDVCARTRTAPAVLACPYGFSFEPGHKKAASVCTKATSSVQMGCPGGTIHHGDGCIMESAIPALSFCPDGTIAQGSSCVRVEQYDCTSGPAYVKGGGRKLEEVEDNYDIPASERELGAKIKLSYHGGSGGPGYGYGNGAGPEATTVSVVAQKCERRVAIPALLQCEQGTLVGRECVVAQEIPLVQVAPAVQVETAAPTASCPHGYTPCNNGKKRGGASDCCATEEGEAQLACPGLYTLSNGVCQMTRPAEMICAMPGYSKKKGHSDCIQTQYIDPIVTYSTQVTCIGHECVEGYVRGGGGGVYGGGGGHGGAGGGHGGGHGH